MAAYPLSEIELAALTERSDGKGLVRLALHVATLAGAGAVYATTLGTAWMLLAAWAYGTCLAFLFAPLHEPTDEISSILRISKEFPYLSILAGPTSRHL